MACDGVERSGRELVTTCYIMQTEKKDLLNFAKYVEKLQPVFFAAGFYQINQRLIVGIFSIVTTYTIICIQFNL